MAADGHHDHGIVATGPEPAHSDRPDDPGNVPGGAPSGSPPGAARSTPSDVPTGAESGDVAQQHRLLLEHLPGAYSLHEMLWDEHGQPRDYRFLDVNPAFEDMTGLSRERVLGRTLFEVLPGIERKWVDIYGRVVSTGQSASFEHRDELMGRHWDVRAWCAGPNRFAVVFSDATRCRVMEGELRRSAAMQRAMIRNIPFDFWARDASGRVVMQSDISVALWGDLTNSPDSERDVPQATRAGWQDINTRVMAGETVRHEHEVQLPDGARRVFASMVTPIRDETADGLLGILGINIDITEQRAAEQALRRSEARFRSLIENALNLPVQGYDRERRVFFWNAASERLYGFTRQEAVGRRLEELIIPEDMADEVRRDMARWVETGIAPRAGELRLRHKDGGPVAVYSSHVALQGPGGEPEMYCIDVDLNNLRRAELALRESEQRFRTLVANLPGVVYRCEATSPWRALFVSDQVEQLTGHPAAEYQQGGLPLEHIIHPDDRAGVIADMAAATDPDGYFSLEYRVLHEDGTLRAVMEQGRRVHDEAGREFLDGVILDVTPLRQALGDLAAARDFLDAVMEAMPSALAGVGPDGLVIHWNRAAEEASGISRDAARGRPAADVLARLVGATPQVHEAVALRQAARFEGVPRVTDGRLRHLDVMLFPLSGQGAAPGVPGAVIVRVDDVTERARLADMLVQTEKMLSVGGLAGGMAHELNNPLGAVLQGVQNIIRRLDPDMAANAQAARDAGVSLVAMRTYMEARRISEMLEGIRDAGARAADIIATMLEFTRPGQGRRTTARAHALAERALALAGSDYDLRRQYDFRKLHVVRDYAESVDTLTCVPTEIEQVLLNLFKNAAHAMAEKDYPAGQTPALHVSTRREGDEVVIVVEDNGPGMEPDVRRRVFEPFFTTKPPGVGTGLGLAVSYFIVVRTHGGSITCDGVPGEGARFTVRLPARQAVDS
ncbi:PAS domain S-box protein [Nitratidesulfovibrio sp. SRB-5]|uniref:PAS domain S-box protein n=1 Tax=Nitratidesulfovibrio sp. SRB-5 TaxID=2872636 RepID=UPI00102594DD|nr:PAS domain S-box protein [Nitratidesulfovibrio sp. SRB-5]MBZ2170820.1 PAS domain S-box protein [Nitratidesulfovibrio sp. SRB-5]RXF76578.1 PAS domain S-box protein [Desulfovibrio sp. DS-1]